MWFETDLCILVPLFSVQLRAESNLVDVVSQQPPSTCPSLHQQTVPIPSPLSIWTLPVCRAVNQPPRRDSAISSATAQPGWILPRVSHSRSCQFNASPRQVQPPGSAAAGPGTPQPWTHWFWGAVLVPRALPGWTWATSPGSRGLGVAGPPRLSEPCWSPRSLQPF